MSNTYVKTDITETKSKILEFIKKQEKPISLKVIKKEFSEVSEETITVSLQMLKTSNEVYKSLKNGKAMYSTNPKHGEGCIGTQKNIQNLNIVINQKLSPKPSAEATSHISKNNLNDIKLTYKNKQKYENKHYSLLIPDYFTLEEYVDGFIAKSKDDEEFPSITLEDAKKIFELHNIFNREYETLDSDDYSYIGLDNLKDEVKFFKQKFKKLNLDEYKNNSEAEDFMEFFIEMTKENNKYKDLAKYTPSYYDDFTTIKDIFECNIIETKSYYWMNHIRIDEAEWNDETKDGFEHWYEVIELYDAEQPLPFNLEDKEVVSIFGSKKFISLADLSYGC